MSILDKLSARIAGRRQASRQSYDELVKSIADGKDRAIDKGEDTLLAAGRSFDELQADVARLLHRRELAAVVAAAEGVEGELAAAHAEVERVKDEHVKAIIAAETALDAALAPLVGRISELDATAAAALRARSELQSGAAQSLKDQVQGLKRKFNPPNRHPDANGLSRQLAVRKSEEEQNAEVKRRLGIEGNELVSTDALARMRRIVQLEEEQRIVEANKAANERREAERRRIDGDIAQVLLKMQEP